jgi:hypothetical protein
MKDYKLKLRDLRSSHTLGWSWNLWYWTYASSMNVGEVALTLVLMDTYSNRWM